MTTCIKRGGVEVFPRLVASEHLLALPANAAEEWHRGT